MKSLEQLREEIDAVDMKLLECFEERMAVAREIGNAKRRAGLDVLDEQREDAKLGDIEKEAGFESRPYARELYGTVMKLARDHQSKPAFGVLGRSLPHTYSPEIHNIVNPSYSYSVIEREEEELDELYAGKYFKGFNVTIPYKKDAFARADVRDKAAEATGSVNTVVFGDDGKVYGYNTDCFGFTYMLHRAGVDPAGKKILMLGTGGAACAVEHSLKSLDAGEIIACDLNTEVNYSNVYERAASCEILVNCTPVGMYPGVDKMLVDITRFPKLEACLDVIYNPSRTKLLQSAEEKGLKVCGGLAMLVAQAYKSSKIFTGDIEGAENINADDEKIIENVIRLLENRMRNITLIGMPGSGKSILARHIAKITGRKLVDLDEAYREKFSESAADTISSLGEDAFRSRESVVAAEVLPQSGLVVSCGGGVVTRDVNKFFVRCNSNVFYLDRPLSAITDKNRPVSIANGIAVLYEQRKDKYDGWSDCKISFDRFDNKQEFLDTASKAVLDILEGGEE